MQYFKVPNLWEDEATSRRAEVLHMAHIFIFFGGFLYIIIPSWILNGQVEYLFITILVSVIGFGLLRAGKVKWSGIWTTGVLWLIFTAGSASEGGVTSGSFAGTLAMVVFAGLAYGSTGAIVISCMSIVAGGVLVYLKLHALMPVPAIVYSDLNILSDFTVYIAITTLFTVTAIRRIERSTRRFEAELSERKKAEVALRESELRWQFALEGAGDGVWDWNLQTDNVYFSHQWKAMLGFRDDELTDTLESWRSRVHPEDESFVLRAVQDHLSGRTPTYMTEHRVRRKDGTYMWILDRGKVISRGPGGNALRMIGTHSDISERKQAEQSNRYLAQALQSMNEIVTITDSADRLTYVNEAFLKTYQYAREDVLGRDIRIIRSANNAPERIQALSTRDRGSSWQGEILNVSKDGVEFPVLLHVSPVRDDAGVIIGYVGIGEDISERKRAELALQKSEEKFVKIFRTNPSALVITRVSDGMILDVNPGFELMTGYSRDEAVGRTVADLKLWVDDSRRVELDAHLLQERRLRDLEFQFRAKDGRVFPGSYLVESIELGGELCALAVVIDMTERRRLEEGLLQAQKLESIGTLAAGIAHDFNNILNIIVGNADLLASRPGDTEKGTRRIEAIVTAAERASQMVRQLLTFARKTQVHRVPLAMNDVISETVKLIGETFPKTITVSLDLAAHLPPVIADPHQIQQVMLNLCVNARDAMSSGGTLSFATRLVTGLELRGRFAEAALHHYVSVVVKDNGVGMDAHTREHMFDPFFTTKGVGKGTGLGMSVVQGIIQSHEAFIDVNSVRSHGTAIEIYLPVSPEATSPTDIGEAADVIPGGHETVLFVEDEELTREIAEDALTSKGYRVITARDGKDGVERFVQHAGEIDVVVSDFGLPEFNGEEVFRRVSALDPHVPFILISGFLEPETKTDLREKGVREIIAKPFKVNELLKAVRGVLDRNPIHR